MKTDTPIPDRMKAEDWYKVDVITCAAPNLRGLWFDDMKEYEIHVRRFTAIFEVARRMGADVVILGAFGCGAFANRLEVVARAAYDALNYYRGVFNFVFGVAMGAPAKPFCDSRMKRKRKGGRSAGGCRTLQKKSLQIPAFHLMINI